MDTRWHGGCGHRVLRRHDWLQHRREPQRRGLGRAKVVDVISASHLAQFFVASIIIIMVPVRVCCSPSREASRGKSGGGAHGTGQQHGHLAAVTRGGAGARTAAVTFSSVRDRAADRGWLLSPLVGF